jgi:hypothetical protein
MTCSTSTRSSFSPTPPAATSLADPLANPQDITNYGLGLNWYLSPQRPGLARFLPRRNFTLPTARRLQVNTAPTRV